MKQYLVYGCIAVISLLLCRCGVSKNTASFAPVKSIQLNTLKVKNLSEEVTQNDELEIHVFFVDQYRNVLSDNLILLEFTAVDQSRSIRYPVSVSGKSGILHIAIIEQDSEQDQSSKHHQTLKRTFTNPNWQNTPQAELALSKQLGDDDLLGIKTIPVNSNKKHTVPAALTYEGSHLMDRFLYLLRLSVEH